MKKQLTPKKMIGASVKILLVVAVLLFLGLQSLNFFEFIFPPEDWFYSYLGFGLTSAAVVAYLMVFKMDADTPMKRTISVVMMVICVIGELATAGFGMQVEGWKNMGYTITEDDFRFMVLGVQVLALFHGMALIAYFAGDDIVTMFQDDDKDGVPNIIDSDYERQKKLNQSHAMASETEENFTQAGNQPRE